MKNLEEILKKVPPKFYNPLYPVKKIGSGESNANFLLQSGEKKFVLRICDHNQPKRLLAEFETIKSLPFNLAPRVYYLDMDSQKPFMIQEFIAGTHPKIWTLVMLKKFARELAQLHRLKKDYVEFSGQKHSKIDVTKYTSKVNLFFFTDCPELKNDQDLSFLSEKIKKFIKGNLHLFKNIKNFSLIHGDLASVNIIQGPKIKIIDWEFAHYFDNARDFATFCYDDYIYNKGKWRVHLTENNFEIFLKEYLKHYPDSSLKERIDFWTQIDKYYSLIYMKWKLYKSNKSKITLSKQQIEFEIKKLIKSLNKRLP